MKFLHQVAEEESRVEKARSLIRELENFCKRVGGVPRSSEKEFWSFKLTCLFPEEKDILVDMSNVRGVHPILINVEKNGGLFYVPETKYFSFENGKTEGKISRTTCYSRYEGKGNTLEVVVDRSYEGVSIIVRKD